jgi:hypothetical protein
LRRIEKFRMNTRARCGDRLRRDARHQILREVVSLEE